MENNPTAPATRTYRVWADHLTRVYQEVEAQSPEKAHELAWQRPEYWQDWYEFEDRDDYRIADDVQDLKTEDYFTVVDVEHCKTCGSEIEETVNGSNFKEGECGPCEYQRYRSQSDLLDAAGLAFDEIMQWNDLMDGSEDPRTKAVLDALTSSLKNAHGKPSR